MSGGQSGGGTSAAGDCGWDWDGDWVRVWGVRVLAVRAEEVDFLVWETQSAKEVQDRQLGLR
jgi:hypothetical protein